MCFITGFIVFIFRDTMPARSNLSRLTRVTRLTHLRSLTRLTHLRNFFEGVGMNLEKDLTGGNGDN